MKHTLISFLVLVLLSIVGCVDTSHQKDVDAGFIELERESIRRANAERLKLGMLEV